MTTETFTNFVREDVISFLVDVKGYSRNDAQEMIEGNRGRIENFMGYSEIAEMRDFLGY